MRAACWNLTCSSRCKVVPNSGEVVVDSNVSKVLREKSELNNVDSGEEIVRNKGNRPHRETNRMYKWKEIALMLDKCFMYTYILLVVTITVACLAVLGSEYNNL